MDYRLNDKVYSEVDLSFLTLDELNQLSSEIVQEINNLAKQKQKLSTLPKGLKDAKSFKKLVSVKTRLIKLNDFQIYISSLKRKLKKSAHQQIEWYKSFYKNVQEKMRDKKFENIVHTTDVAMGYSIK